MIRLTRTTRGTYLRVGRCSRCGDCCQGCPLLSFDAALATCAGYGTHPIYLNGCNDFPVDPVQRDEGSDRCSYRFVRIGPGRRVR